MADFSASPVVTDLCACCKCAPHFDDTPNPSFVQVCFQCIRFPAMPQAAPGSVASNMLTLLANFPGSNIDRFGKLQRTNPDVACKAVEAEHGLKHSSRAKQAALFTQNCVQQRDGQLREAHVWWCGGEEQMSDEKTCSRAGLPTSGKHCQPNLTTMNPTTDSTMPVPALRCSRSASKSISFRPPVW